MTLKYQFNRQPNPDYNPKEINAKLLVEEKLSKAARLFTQFDAQNNNRIEYAKECVDQSLSGIRKDIKQLENIPKEFQEIKITSELKWKMYPEFIDDDGRTHYKKAEEFSVNKTIPYSRRIVKTDNNGHEVYDDNDELVYEDINMKEAIKVASDKALQPLKEYRKKSRELQMIEKSFNVKGLPFEIGRAHV